MTIVMAGALRSPSLPGSSRGCGDRPLGLAMVVVVLPEGVSLLRLRRRARARTSRRVRQGACSERRASARGGADAGRVSCGRGGGSGGGGSGGGGACLGSLSELRPRRNRLEAGGVRPSRNLLPGARADRGPRPHRIEGPRRRLAPREAMARSAASGRRGGRSCTHSPKCDGRRSARPTRPAITSLLNCCICIDT